MKAGIEDNVTLQDQIFSLMVFNSYF